MSKRGAIITAFLFAVMFSVFIFPAKIAKAATKGSVTATVLNVRSGPGTEYEKMTTVIMGQAYPVISSQNGWYRLQIGSVTGWVSGDYLTLVEEKPAPTVTAPSQPTPMGKVKVTADILNVRETASTSSEKIGSVKMNETYQYYEKSGEWFKIKYGSSYGWVSGTYVIVIPDEETKPETAQPAETEQPQQQEQPTQPVQTEQPEQSENEPEEEIDDSIIKTGDTVIAKIDQLTVRSTKSLSASIIGRAEKGSTYSVLESQDKWIKIQFKKSTTGWVRSVYVEKTTANPSAPADEDGAPTQNDETISAGEDVTVNTALLTVRADKEVDAKIIGNATKGSTYEVLESAPGWIKIQFGSRKGWIKSEYVASKNGGTNTSGQTGTTNLNQIDSIKIYSTAKKSSIAIPVTMKVDINSNISTFKPDIVHSMDQNGRIVVTVNNSRYAGSSNIIDASSNLVSSILALNEGQSSVKITVNPNTTLKYNIADVQTKVTKDSQYMYLKTYVVINVEDANSQSTNSMPGVELNSQGKARGDYIIALDAGHGGSTPGAVNGQYKEKDLVLDIILRANNILKAQGFDIYLTRDADKYVSLADRAEGPNILKADIFVSVHLNSFTSKTTNGTETLYNSQAVKPGATLAQYIQNQLISELGRTNRGIVSRPDLAVLNSTNMPAALAEILFISNPEELELIKDDNTKQKAAQAIANAINQYFGFSY
ncbi:N-acetylmuramoyl-L-alanine amidase AmiC precursor [Oxobacter pfennigii]|uniref:N-acetylmuramoyl-L-alanine amidase AmiC n=1 Tax=Oxobacter pfennigii TaxID=36849 RepID=A0A0P8X576_9CLOT|nr:N-acetylmuramoyl-L-alanine amidase [Oxobacter pfennigii]KPU45947.1 N-acetylmuramoyl-L-alanine amidase AmiC precursor [Oxobacter pfennigii]